MAKKSLLEEAQASPWNEMDEHLSYRIAEPIVYGKPFDCSDEDYVSFIDYHIEHMWSWIEKLNTLTSS